MLELSIRPFKISKGVDGLSPSSCLGHTTDLWTVASRLEPSIGIVQTLLECRLEGLLLGPGQAGQLLRWGFDRSGTQLQGPFRIYSLTEIGGFASRGSGATAKRGSWPISRLQLGSSSVCLLPNAQMSVSPPGFLGKW